MYYILRSGYPGRGIELHEFRNAEIAYKAFSIKSSLYESMFQNGIIPYYTCLLITKGVRNNEEAKSAKHGNIQSSSN